MNCYKIKKKWNVKSQTNRLIGEIKKTVKKDKVICALSGGVDSSVVALLVNKAIKKVPIDIIQFHGNESDAFINSFNIPKIKVIKVKDNIEDSSEFNNTLLFDTYSNTSEGGTGRAFNWNLLNHYKKQNFILSGGLNNGNILKAISKVNPGAIDICSGLEKKPGHKCHQKVNEFFQKIKNTKETEFDFAKLSN